MREEKEEGKKDVISVILLNFLFPKHKTQTLSVSGTRAIRQERHPRTSWGTKSPKKQKHVLCATATVGRQRCREQTTRVFWISPGRTHRDLVGNIFLPITHTHTQLPEGVSRHLNIKRILCFDKITVYAQREAAARVRRSCNSNSLSFCVSDPR